MPFCPSLSNEDAARSYELSACGLDAEALRVRVASVTCRTLSFLMGHVLVSLNLYNISDLNTRVALSVSYFSTDRLASFILKSDHFWSFDLLEQFSMHDGLGHIRSADLRRISHAHKEHVFKFYFLTCFHSGFQELH